MRRGYAQAAQKGARQLMTSRFIDDDDQTAKFPETNPNFSSLQKEI
jgi:hypothetical protein